jgi:hypothetical protein
VNKFLTAVLILLSSSPTIAQTGFYVEVGASYHDERTARPEVNLQTPLASFELGYQNSDDWSVGFKHTLSIPQIEDGYGINELFISKRIWVK